MDAGSIEQEDSRTVAKTTFRKSNTFMNSVASSKGMGFREFKTTNDLREIEKWLDQKEIKGDESRKALLAQEGLSLDDWAALASRDASMFFAAFRETVTLVADRQAAGVLSRVAEGLACLFSQFEQKLKLVNARHRERLSQAQTSFKALQEQFRDFQEKNDLDRFFAQNLDSQTRATVVREVQDLLRSSQLQIDKGPTEATRFSGSTRTLSDIQQDYELTIRERLNFYMRQNEEDIGSHQQPIPAATYKQQLDARLSQNYQLAVEKTAKRIAG